jgi:hypothetical protein
MKWTERWIARAQRKADARDERYRRSQAGEIPYSPLDGLAARRQAAFDQQRARRQAVLGRYPELASYTEAHNLLRRDGGSFRGPDGVEVCVWHAAGDQIWPGWPALPSRWHRSRKEWLFAMAGYGVSLPLKILLLKSHEMHRACAYTMSGPPVWIDRAFPSSEEAVLYAALLAKRVQTGGVEALREHALSAPEGQGGEGFGPLNRYWSRDPFR